MQLSYTGRLICLALCSAGLLQLGLDLLARVAAPFLLRQSATANARLVERSMFLLALFVRLTPWLIVLGAWLPTYVRGEDNLSRERVGLLCIGGAVGVAGLLLLCCLRALRAWISTRRFCNQCQEAGTSPNGVPVLLHSSDRPFLALAGVFHSRIVISRPLLTSGRFSPAALNIAFSHETAHARHRDNLKLLILSLLPHTPFALGKRPSIEQQWRLAAEMAADEDGARGRPECSVVLAELLVAMARESSQIMLNGSFALLARAEDLPARVNRLLERRILAAPGSHKTLANLQTYCAVTLALGSIGTLWYLCTELGHHAAEILLHIG